MASKKVALITGGASGMGLSVASALCLCPDWDVHILDLNTVTGAPAVSAIGATFHQSSVIDEASLSFVFKNIVHKHHRLDFVFANAGIAERANFYDSPNATEGEGPLLPVKGMHDLIDVNLKSVITTTYLALHYMWLTPRDTDKSIVMTASCGGLYPSYYSPIYTATKHAVVGFMRSIAPWFQQKAGIRVNAICPGTVKTNLLSTAEWGNFPENYFTPVEKIAEVVLMLIDAKEPGTGKTGSEVQGGIESIATLSGRAVEVSGENHYYREAVAYCDEAMAAVMGSTNIEVLDNVQEAG